MNIGAIKRQLPSEIAQDRTDRLIAAVGGLIGDSNGLISLVTRLNDSGLREVSSWIRTSPNRPVGATRLADALGADDVQRVAEQAGVSYEQAQTGIAAALPEIVDQLTPIGALPAYGVSDALSSLHGGSEVTK